MSDTAFDPWDLDTTSSTRAPRTLDTRQLSERKRNWQPSSILPDPTPRDGWVFRYCRMETRNQSDHTTYQKRLREGWEPVRAEDHPELMVEMGLGDDKHKGLVYYGGLVLCRMPEEMAEQRRQYYHDLTMAKTDAAENSFLRDNDERMAKVAEKKRQIAFGQRSR